MSNRMPGGCPEGELLVVRRRAQKTANRRPEAPAARSQSAESAVVARINRRTREQVRSAQRPCRTGGWLRRWRTCRLCTTSVVTRHANCFTRCGSCHAGMVRPFDIQGGIFLAFAMKYAPQAYGKCPVFMRVGGTGVRCHAAFMYASCMARQAPFEVTGRKAWQVAHVQLVGMSAITGDKYLKDHICWCYRYHMNVGGGVEFRMLYIAYEGWACHVLLAQNHHCAWQPAVRTKPG